MGIGSSRTVGYYVDTADAGALAKVLGRKRPTTLPGLVGTTTNQSFIAHEVERATSGTDVLRRPDPGRRAWAVDGPSAAAAVAFSESALAVAESISQTVPSRRKWEISVPLHSSATANLPFAEQFGRRLQRLDRASSLKIMMSPHEPACFLLARDLQRTAIRTNLTCVFSVRQALVAVLLSNVSRVSVFLDRIDQGLDSRGLGEHVALSTQRLILRYRSDLDIDSKLLVANVKQPRQVRNLFGCDYFTLSPAVLKRIDDFSSTGREDMTRMRDAREKRPWAEESASTAENEFAALTSADGDFVQFLLDLRRQRPVLLDGDKLFEMFDDAGFGDMFYWPTPKEWELLGKSRLPKDHPDFLARIPPDTLLSLLAVVDFQRGEQRIWEALKQ